MKLSAPIYHLKRTAKILSREENIPLHEALDRIAEQRRLRWMEFACGQNDCDSTRWKTIFSVGSR